MSPPPGALAGILGRQAIDKRVKHFLLEASRNLRLGNQLWSGFGIMRWQSRQQVVGLVAHEGAVRPLGEGFLSDRLKQRAIHDRRLFARQDLTLVFDLADIEVVAEQVVQRAAAERGSPQPGLMSRRTSPSRSC